MSAPTYEQIAAILDGIDSDECSTKNGWWETYSGADFGAAKLAAIKALFDAAPSAPVAPDERAAFEKWARNQALFRDMKGSESSGNPWYYFEGELQATWEAWQARAALSVKAGSLAAEWGIAQIDLHHARQLELTMIEKRIGITPEYEGGFNAAVYEGEESPVATGHGNTPSEAVRAALLAAAPTPPTTGEA